MLTKAGAQVGDRLFLTKPLGVGIITTAFKGDAAAPEHFAAAVDSMKRLNRQASQLAQQIGVHACTDVSGFSLLGHGYEIAEKSGVRLRFVFESLPFIDGAKQYAHEQLFPGGSCKNQNCYAQHVQFEQSITEEMQLLLFTPETSGGLLLAIAPEKAEALSALFSEHEHRCWEIGEIVAGSGIEVQ
jgi:selenide,water dikinase